MNANYRFRGATRLGTCLRWLAAISLTWALSSTVVFASLLLVADGAGNSVLEYQTSSPAFLGAFVSPGSGGLVDPRGLTFGPDGNLYVSYFDAITGFGHYNRYDGQTGAFIDVFHTTNNTPRSPFGLTFGPDGNLYTTITNINTVNRDDGSTGAFIDNFVTVGLSDPRDLAFGPDGNLYVANAGSHTVTRYDGTTGALIGVFATGVDARGLTFGPDGNLYVADFSNDRVLEFNGSTGAPIATFASGGGLDGPVGVLFGPDDGDLYVSGFNSNNILRYDGSTGAFIDVIGSGGDLHSPRLMAFVPEVPEPATFALFSLGLAGLGFSGRRRA